MATGLVGEDVEGLFVLDHVTGNLIGMVINPRTGTTGALYNTNVFASLGISRDNADLVMTTGRINVPGGQGNQTPALCVVYVGDSNTGKVVGYSCFYNQARANQGGNQGGAFTQVFSGQTRGEYDQSKLALATCWALGIGRWLLGTAFWVLGSRNAAWS